MSVILAILGGGIIHALSSPYFPWVFAVLSFFFAFVCFAAVEEKNNAPVVPGLMMILVVVSSLCAVFGCMGKNYFVLACGIASFVSFFAVAVSDEDNGWVLLLAVLSFVACLPYCCHHRSSQQTSAPMEKTATAKADDVHVESERIQSASSRSDNIRHAFEQQDIRAFLLDNDNDLFELIEKTALIIENERKEYERLSYIENDLSIQLPEDLVQLRKELDSQEQRLIGAIEKVIKAANYNKQSQDFR